MTANGIKGLLMLLVSYFGVVISIPVHEFSLVWYCYNLILLFFALFGAFNFIIFLKKKFLQFQESHKEQIQNRTKKA